MKALFIGGPLDGQEREVRGRRHEVEYPDGLRKDFKFYHLFSDDGERRWIFAVEEGKTPADAMDALYKKYMRE